MIESLLDERMPSSSLACFALDLSSESSIPAFIADELISSISFLWDSHRSLRRFFFFSSSVILPLRTSRLTTADSTFAMACCLLTKALPFSVSASERVLER